MTAAMTAVPKASKSVASLAILKVEMLAVLKALRSVAWLAVLMGEM
jgi:hypothetical protein